MNYFKISKFFLYLIPLGVFLVTRSTLFPFIVGKYVWFRTLTGLALVFFLIGLLLSSRQAEVYLERLKNIVKSPLFIAVSVFVTAFLVAGFFGIDPHNSFWSNFERGEGGLQILNMYVFFVLLITLFKSESDWKKLFVIFILSATLMIFYGLGAGFKYIDAEMTFRINYDGVEQWTLTGEGGPWYQTFKNYIGSSFDTPNYRFQGSIGNPAYVATYLIFTLFFAGYLLTSQFKRLGNGKKLLLSVGVLVFGLFFFLAATRGAFVGLGAGIFAALLYLAYMNKSWRKPAMGTLILLMLVVGSLIYFRSTPFVKKIPSSRIFDISFSAETFQHRAIMWGIAWEGFKERPVFGWGPESYIQMFYEHYSPAYYTPGKSYGAWFDRAHSIIFDYLAETGIVGLLSYMGIFVVFFWQFAKSSIRTRMPLITSALFLALPVAYLVQGLVLFDVSTTYLSLFTFFAFSVYIFSSSNVVYQDYD